MRQFWSVGRRAHEGQLRPEAGARPRVEWAEVVDADNVPEQEVAEAVDDRCAAVDLETLDVVRTGAPYEVGTGRDIT